MKNQTNVAANAAVLCALVLLTGCGGGGGGSSSPSPSPPPPPPAPANRAPVLTPFTLTTDEDTSATGQLAATDPDGNPVTFALTTNAQHGTATVTTGGALSYMPSSNYSGADSISVTVSDNAGGQATGTVDITVNPVNDAPTLVTTQVAVDEDAVLNGQLEGADVEGDTFTFEYVPGVAHGTLTMSSSGSFTYTPLANYSGSDQFTVRLVESGGAASEHTVSIDVRPVNDAPVAVDDALRIPAAGGAPVALAVVGNDTDVEGGELTPEVVTQPDGGTVSVNATTREIIFEPDNGYVGPIAFTYRVSDGSALSNIATINANIGSVEDVIFLSDYTTPGTLELHVFDGLEVRRVSDDLPSGGTLSTFTVSGDARTLAYIVDGADEERVYVKSLDDSSPAVLRFTSAAKTVPAEQRVSVTLNADGTYLLIRDGWAGDVKVSFVVNVANGVSRHVAGNMPGISDTRVVLFHPYEPQLLLAQGQTSGTGPNDLANRATSAFIGSAADPRTLEQIGQTYAPGQCGSGEGIYVGNDGRYIYHAEYLCDDNVINLIAYDRVNETEAYVVRQAALPDHGLNGVASPNPAVTRLCFAFYEPTATTNLGPTRFYTMDTANPASAGAVSPIHERTTQCTMSSDDQTIVYRVHTPDFLYQQAFAIGPDNAGAPVLLAPDSELISEQGALQLAVGAPRAAIAYFGNDGVPGFTFAEVGNYYTFSLNGPPDYFRFSGNYVQPNVGSVFNSSSKEGDFILYARPHTGRSALELMSTHVLNLSIPLSRPGETIGVRSMRWLRAGVR